MADFNEIKDVVINTLGTVAEKTRSLAGKATDKAKDVTRIAKLNMELNSEKDSMQKTFAEIGKLYYETTKDLPDRFFVQLFDEVALTIDNIDKLKAEIDEVKTGIDPKACKDCDIEVEFEDLSSDESSAPQASDEELIKKTSNSSTDELEATPEDEQPLPEQPAE